MCSIRARRRRNDMIWRERMNTENKPNNVPSLFDALNTHIHTPDFNGLIYIRLNRTEFRFCVVLFGGCFLYKSDNSWKRRKRHTTIKLHMFYFVRAKNLSIRLNLRLRKNTLIARLIDRIIVEQILIVSVIKWLPSSKQSTLSVCSFNFFFKFTRIPRLKSIRIRNLLGNTQTQEKTCRPIPSHTTPSAYVLRVQPYGIERNLSS